MNFGKGITIAFVFFALFIGTLVFICIKQDINLVSADYYQQELAHSQKMNQIANTKDLVSEPIITVVGNRIEITFQQFDELEEGELKLIRPSDVKLDQKFELHSSQEHQQKFTMKNWERGLYRASMKWTMNGKEYYFEKLIVI
jgi:hypothetical protein